MFVSIIMHVIYEILSKIYHIEHDDLEDDSKACKVSIYMVRDAMDICNLRGFVPTSITECPYLWRGFLITQVTTLMWALGPIALSN